MILEIFFSFLVTFVLQCFVCHFLEKGERGFFGKIVC